MGTIDQAPGLAEMRTRLIGRQPILDKGKKLFGHELLFRSGTVDAFSGDSEAATRDVIDHYLLLMPTAGDEVSFVNCTREALTSGIVTLLPPERTVLEILETVDPDPELLECCMDLKGKGYRFALDDFVPNEVQREFFPIASFIKIDFQSSDAAVRKQIYTMAAGAKVRFLAEKVETAEDVRIAQLEGCDLFQGYFFCKPILVSTRIIPQNQLVYLRLLAALTETPANLIEIERLVMSDASICYRLLRLVNSAMYGLTTPVESIRAALLRIGEDEFRKLVTIALASTAKASQPDAVLQMALERARFCEQLAPLMHESPSKLYLLGMLSLIDVILATPMNSLVDSLGVDAEMKAALLGKKCLLGSALDLVRCHESGDWQQYKEIQTELRIPAQDASTMYLNSVAWASQALSAGQ
jgi:c-di-GMP-related signal transduction protein